MDLVDQQNFNNYPELSRQKHKPARIYPNLAFFSRLLEKLPRNVLIFIKLC